MADKTQGRHLRPVWIAAAAILLSASSAASGQNPALETALQFFTRHDAAAFLERFDTVRPAPVTPAERELVLAALPAKGAIPDPSLNTIQRHKLAAARRVLAFHHRDAVYVVKVVDIPRAAVALHARAVLLISKPALDLLRPEELQALVAHEAGHEYFWDEYFQAQRDEDRSALRRLELLCDGVAIVTLGRVGTAPGHLTSALAKVIRYNRERFGVAQNEDDYPAIADRRTFARRLVEWIGPSGVAPASGARRTDSMAGMARRGDVP
jgi:hypothetical protein